METVVACVNELNKELEESLRKAVKSVGDGISIPDFAESLGLSRGVTGYTNHTVPVAIHAWLSHPTDLRSAITGMIHCGGDADTTAAIVGGIVGARVGEAGIPPELLDGIWEWPRDVNWMKRLSLQLAESLENDSTEKAIGGNPVSVFIRNLLFLFVVLFHGFRRLAPPY